MTLDQQNPEVIRQPAHGETVKLPRPPLDWGDEEPDMFWEDLYNRGLVNPPYRTLEEQSEFWKSFFRSYQPVGEPMADDELMCALGRCHCDRCQ